MKQQFSNIYFGVRKWRDKFFDKLASWLVSKRISANSITLVRIILALSMFWLVSVSFGLVIIFLILDFLLDGIDGVVARKAKTSSNLGRLLDLTTDDLFAAPMILGFIWFNLVNPFWAAAYLFLMTVDFFLNHLRFSFEAGKYPFSFSKYFVYLAVLIMVFGGPDFIDVVLIFWSIVLLILNVHATVDLYKRHAGNLA